MSWNHFNDFKYISVAERKQQALKKMKTLQQSGAQLKPVAPASTRGLIANSFWGKAWCKHLEAFSDYAYRLPRGRSYIRHSAVIDLQIQPQTITALVNGSELYELTIAIDLLPATKWTAIKSRCRGQIGSLIELLQGKFSNQIMSLVTDSGNGLFPQPNEIHFNCNCPDWADMCKHIAAALYGVGVRLDQSPELLFTLRGVDHGELIALDSDLNDLTKASSRHRRTLQADSLNAVFGIELDNHDSPDEAATKPTDTKPFTPTPARIRRLRRQLDLSMAAFAREIGVSATTIRNWEKKVGPLKLQTKSVKQLKRLQQAMVNN